jgi:uncharacterized protein (TIGR04255 family)
MLNLNDLTNIASGIENEYPDVPRFLLMPRPGETIDLGPLRWEKQELVEGMSKINSLQLGRNFIIFNFESYKTWGVELKNILKVIKNINNNFSLPLVKETRLHYIDEFLIEHSDFDFIKYFNIGFTEDLKISKEDFVIGFVPYEKENGEIKRKAVLRLKALGKQNENYKFSLESIFLIRNLSTEINNIESYLDDAHEKIEHYFISFLTDSYQKELGLDYIDTEQI